MTHVITQNVQLKAPHVKSASSTGLAKQSVNERHEIAETGKQ